MLGYCVNRRLSGLKVSKRNLRPDSAELSFLDYLFFYKVQRPSQLSPLHFRPVAAELLFLEYKVPYN